MVICELCERKEAQVDALIDGEYKNICSQCAKMHGAVVVEKPSQQKIELSQYSRPKVRQVLNRMAGINSSNYSPESSRPQPVRNPYANLRIPASRKNVSLDDLREVKKANEVEDKQLNSEINQIEDVEAEVEENKSKVSWFKRIFSRKKKEEFKEVQPGETVPGPAAEEQPEKVSKVRIVDSRQ